VKRGKKSIYASSKTRTYTQVIEKWECHYNSCELAAKSKCWAWPNDLQITSCFFLLGELKKWPIKKA